jgi:hypothetical protein
MNALLVVLKAIDALLVAASQIPGIGDTALVAEALEQIALKAVQAHQDIVGMPLDLSKLHDIQPK